MKKIKVCLILIIMIVGISLITGCGNKKTNKPEEPNTVATKLSKQFESLVKKEKNIETVAQELSKSEVIVPEVQTYEIKNGDYIAGFKEEIKGYKNAIGIAPMINTIPMIAYIFEVEEPEKFAEFLEENADLRWNICTEADEMKVTVVDNYIFFIMSPTSFEE